MPVVLAVLVYAGRVLSRPMGARLKQRRASPFLVLAVAVVVPALWVQFRPSGLATLSFWGELAGVWLVYLLSCLLVLGTGPGGWSRGSAAWTACTCRTQWTAVVATVTLAPHLLTGIGATLSYASPLGTGPRGGCAARPAHLVLVSLARVEKFLRLPYRRWLFLYRLTRGVRAGRLDPRGCCSTGSLVAPHC